MESDTQGVRAGEPGSRAIAGPVGPATPWFVATLLALLVPHVDLAAQAIVLTEAAQAAGLTAVHQAPPWPTNPMSAGGAAAADLDHDGDCDVFVAGGGLVPDHLFENDGAGGFTDQAVAWGVAHTHVGGGVALGDHDGDGRDDLYVVSHGQVGALQVGQHRLYRNVSDGVLVDVAAAAGVDTTSPFAWDGFGAAFGDTDLDGDLELFVTGWRVQLATPSMGNVYFLNDGGGSYRRHTDEGILVDLSSVFGFSPVFSDMNADGFPELLLVGDFETSLYLVNQGDGTFVDGTAAAGTSLESNGMGQAVLDVEGDGLLDWYVTSIEPQPGHHEDASGNMLYRNQGGDVFVETSVASGVNVGGWGWGAVAVDLDLDGRVDLAETNGWQTSPYAGMPNHLFHNLGAGSFLDVTASAGFAQVLNGRGLLTLDGEGDGDPDLLLLGWDERLRYYRNDPPVTAGGWLGVELDAGGMGGVPTGGLGARLELTAGGATQLRSVHDGGSYLASSQRRQLFGLGQAAQVDRLSVHWPEGTRRDLLDLASGQVVTVVCCGGFLDMGGGVAGAGGLPVLGASGALEALAPVSLTIVAAAPHAPLFLVLGIAPALVPFKAGLLVPSPDVILGGILADAAGAVAFDVPWPAGAPPGASLYLQAWIPDGLAPAGFAASNGLKITAP